MVDFVALVTPPILAGPNGEPANGDIYARTTSTVSVSGKIVPPFQIHGKVVEGDFKSLDDKPLLLVVTPEGVGLEIVVDLFQHGPSGKRDKYSIKRTVSTPNQSTVTWDALVDVVPVDAGADYVIPSWVAELLANAVTAGSAASSARDGAVAARGEAVTAKVQAQTAAAAAQAVGTTNDTLIAGRINDPSSATTAALSATIAEATEGLGAIGSGVARFIERARAGENLKIVAIGDSILEGNTVTNPATDGALIRLAADLSSRFGIVVTPRNHAQSGSTAARAFILGNVASALAENGDLYIISAFDKNDIPADRNGQYVPGHPLAASVAAIERMVREIRRSAPKADIILLGTNPFYPVGNGLNPYVVTKQAAVRRLAAAVGAEYVDAYTPFIEFGNYSTLLADALHPNTAGHRLMADTMLKHFVDTEKPAQVVGAIAERGLYPTAAVVDTRVDKLGYMLAAAPGTHHRGALTWTNGGTGWTGGTSSTVDSWTEFVFTGVEMMARFTTTKETPTIVDVTLDGAITQNVNLSADTVGSAYWTTLAYELAHGTHTIRLTLKSGTLTVNQLAALSSRPAFQPESQIVEVAKVTTVVPLATDGANTVVAAVPLNLPVGWFGAKVLLSGYLGLRVLAGTTTERRILPNFALAVAGLEIPAYTTHSFPATAVDLYGGVPVQATVNLAASGTLSVRASVASPDKDKVQVSSCQITAVMVRTA